VRRRAFKSASTAGLTPSFVRFLAIPIPLMPQSKRQVYYTDYLGELV
jgi:hypothetical protein